MSFRWGILATGRIAAAMAEALRLVPDAELLAVGSRNRTTAERFATRWSVPRAYGDYGQLLADPEVDIVYVATPNALHRDHIMAALDAGKHVLCEKPLTASAADSRACAEHARRSGRFLMEAMWTAFLPAVRRAVELVEAGAIGAPRHLTAHFVAQRDPAEFPNLFDPALGGGASLDLGVYPLTVAGLLGGPIERLSAEVVWGRTGVDEMVVAAARHDSGVVSNLSWGFRTDLPVDATLVGDEGILRVVPPLQHPDTLLLTRDGSREELHLPRLGVGYAHEAMEVHACIAAGLLESPAYPLDASIRTAGLIEGIIGIREPGQGDTQPIGWPAAPPRRTA